MAYSGVYAETLNPGWNQVTTGTAGTSVGSDYSMPTYYPDGTPIGPNDIIPPGTQLVIYNPAGGGGNNGYNVVTGSEILNDQAYQDDVTSQIQTRAANIALQEKQFTEQARQFQLEFDRAGEIAEQQYQLDVQRLGIEKADLLYRQRLSDAQGKFMEATAQLNAAQFGLQQNQFNASQRQFRAQSEQNILQMLADRSGPQDWVAYNRLLNGLEAPEAERTATIDPFARLNDLYQESNIVLPPAPQWTSVAGPAEVAPAGSSSSSGTRTGSSGGTRTSGSGTTQLGGGPAGSLVGQGALGGGPSGSFVDPAAQNVPAYARNAVPTGIDPTYGTSLVQSGGKFVPPPNPVQYPYAEKGGMNLGTAVVTGDSSSGKENQELAMSATPISIIPIRNDSLPNLAHAETGGTYGTGLNDNTITLNEYSPEVLGSSPFYQKLIGNRPNKEFGGFGAALSNPQLGLSDVPFNINLRNYYRLQPTEQAQTQDLFGRGLGVDFGDVFESARRAAPTGARFGPAFYGG